MIVRILPILAAVATFSAVLAAAVVTDLRALIAVAVTMWITLVVTQSGKSNIAWRVVAWTIPLVLPLLFIHGILNGAFPVDHRLFGFIPVRSTGIDYGSAVAMRMLLISIVGGYWLSILREDMVESLIRSRLPSTVILLLVQGVLMAGIISRRLENVYLAQRARGVPVGGTAIARLRALPSVLIPVIVGTFVEAEGRVPALVAQGFGSLRVQQKPAPKLSSAEHLLLLIPPTAVVAAMVLTKA